MHNNLFHLAILTQMEFLVIIQDNSFIYGKIHQRVGNHYPDCKYLLITAYAIISWSAYAQQRYETNSCG